MKLKWNKKKVIFRSMILLFFYVVLEVSASLFYGYKKDKSFSYSEMQAYRDRVLLEPSYYSYNNDPNKKNHKVAPQSLHPYIGFVRDAKNAPNTSDFGFLGEGTPFVENTNDNVVVAVTGGSFAMGMSRLTEHFENELKKVKAFAGKKVVIVPMALGGFKQPQQFMALSYFLTCGASFDMVINIDGFNEVALPMADNASKRIHPLYPRLWFTRFKKSMNKDIQDMMYRERVLQEERKDLANFYSSFPMSWSVCANVYYQIRDEKTFKRINAIRKQFTDYTVDKKEMDYDVSGPSFPHDNMDRVFEVSTDNWQQSSLQMSRLCTANGIHYFHFIQPNQYLEGSKKMTDKERKIAYKEGPHEYKKAVIKGYPMIKSKGLDLLKAGVDFHDITMMFVDDDTVYYNDTCCHLNVEGYKKVIEEVALRISQTYERK